MPSPSLTEGSLYGILDYLWWDPPIKSGDDTRLRNSIFLGILDFYFYYSRNSRILDLGILEFLNSLLCHPPAPLWISIWNSRLFAMGSPYQVGGWHRTCKADNDTKLWNLEFSKIRHCEALKKEGAISFIKPWTRLLRSPCSLAMTEF